jgi:DNA-binding MarR family transcriptional regulator
MQRVSTDALAAIRAWVRLDAAMTAFNRHLWESYRVTSAQLAMLRLVAELEPVTLAALRTRLALHPATLGQLVQRLAAAGLVNREHDATDRRFRRITLADAGRDIVARAPVAGPVRLRTAPADSLRLSALAQAFDDAIELFGLTAWDES